MEIESISHKALKRFFLTGNSKGLVGDVERLRAMLAFIAAAATFDELAIPPNYNLHRLTGNRGGTWSMTLTRNWRLTFSVTEMATIADLNLEDYHGS
jgi:toxin HigB-1